MNWAILIPIIIQYGLPFAEKLVEKWSSGGAPSLTDIQELKALASKNAKDILLARLVAAGIDPASPQAQALLALT